MECSATTRMSGSHLHTQGVQYRSGRDGGEIVRVRGQGGLLKVFSSGHEGAIRLMNSAAVVAGTNLYKTKLVSDQ